MAGRIASSQSSTVINQRIDRLTAATGEIDRPLLKSSIDVNQAEIARELTSELTPEEAVDMVFEVFDEVGLTDKDAARLMKIDAGQLGRIKAKKGRLPFDALWRLPLRFWVTLLRRINEAKGLTEESIDEIEARCLGQVMQMLASRSFRVRARKAVNA